MIAEIVLIIIAIIAYKTNPNIQSFKLFLEKDQANTQQQISVSTILKNAASLLKTGRKAIPDYKVTNYVFFSIATVEDGRVYIGGLDTWFAYESSNIIDPSSSSGQYDAAENLREKAIHYKADKNHLSAGETYNRAARMFEKCDSDYEAACAYEDAYKCLNQAKCLDLALEALEKAATLFTKRDSTLTRAARLYEQAGKNCKTLKLGDNAATYFGKASEIYDPSDIRSLFAKAQEAETLGEYCNYIFSACACALGLDDWITLASINNAGKSSSGTYFTSTECQFIEALIEAHQDSDEEIFVNLCSTFERSHSLLPWKSRCLRLAMDRMINRATSIT